LISFIYLSTLESKTTTNLLSSSPKYENSELEVLINENTVELELHLNCKALTDNDMEIVGYVLQNNKVNNFVSFYY